MWFIKCNTTNRNQNRYKTEVFALLGCDTVYVPLISGPSATPDFPKFLLLVSLPPKSSGPSFLHFCFSSVAPFPLPPPHIPPSPCLYVPCFFPLFFTLYPDNAPSFCILCFISSPLFSDILPSSTTFHFFIFLEILLHLPSGAPILSTPMS